MKERIMNNAYGPTGYVSREESDRLKAEKDPVREINRLNDMLKMAYCQKTGSDNPIGLDCCDDYRDWLKTLMYN